MNSKFKDEKERLADDLEKKIIACEKAFRSGDKKAMENIPNVLQSCIDQLKASRKEKS